MLDAAVWIGIVGERFNRIARLYQRIPHELAIASANYFDDYPSVELSPLASNTESTLRAIAKMLGFSVASEKGRICWESH